MKHPIHQSKLLAIATLVVFAPFALAEEIDRKADILQEVQRLYGYTEEQAILRLAKEAEAIDTARRLDASSVGSYAGSWFDGESLSLKVAIADQDDQAFVERMGGVPVLVRRSLDELQMARMALKSRLSTEPRLAQAVVRIAVNPRVNAVEVDFMGENTAFIEAAIIDLHMRDAMLVREALDLPVFSSGPLRGGVPTRNWTWGENDPEHDFTDFKCSVGFATEGGYITAGHCGWVGNIIVTPIGGDLGTVEESDWGPEDRGWVKTEPAWYPVPQVDEGGSSFFSVPAAWAGLDRALIGSTVCRYGGTSGGPHCGTINVWDTDQNFWISDSYPWTINIDGVTEVDGSCSEPGDSGGPWVAASTKQAQGTNVGVDPRTSTCQTGADRTFFWPADDTTDAFSVHMLTTHGANPPSTSVNCPDPLAPSGQFLCELVNMYSQGATDISWTSNTGNSSNTAVLLGSCSSGHSVQVNLATINPYGTTQDQFSFTCP